MPWQSVPPLIIIGGAFTLVGGLLPAVDMLTHGKRREKSVDEWTHKMLWRDDMLEAEENSLRKALSKQTSEEKVQFDEFREKHRAIRYANALEKYKKSLA
mmetsp:Transcript_803/g.1030  ORF Transcript_803/g.1030 Transcript_803/m.1030 type:complete len:100 (+) Transcript_803:88-387(+)